MSSEYLVCYSSNTLLITSKSLSGFNAEHFLCGTTIVNIIAKPSIKPSFDKKRYEID